GGHDRAGLVVEAHLRAGVPDVLDRLPDDHRHFDDRGGGDLASNHHDAGLGQGLARHARLGVLGEDGVEDRVRNLVAKLVGMSLGDRFGSELITAHSGSYGSVSSASCDCSRDGWAAAYSTARRLLLQAAWGCG